MTQIESGGRSEPASLSLGAGVSPQIFTQNKSPHSHTEWRTFSPQSSGSFNEEFGFTGHRPGRPDSSVLFVGLG